MKAIKGQGQITRISSRVDGSIGLGLSTSELSSEEKTVFFDLHNQNVEFWIKPMDQSAQEIVEIKTEVDRKTPSQRLRSVLFLVWKSEGEKGEYNDFYVKFMNKVIDNLKEKLE